MALTELQRNKNFQKKSDKAERITVMIMAVLIIMALVLIIGIGPLSKKTLGSAEEGFKVEFQTLLRYKKEVPMKITVKSDFNNKDCKIRINKNFLKGMITEKIIPEPKITFIGKDDYIFSFASNAPSSATTIAFYMKPATIGNKKLIIGEENGELKEMDIFIYP